MKMYPRTMGWPGLVPDPDADSGALSPGVSLGECLLDELWIKPDQNLVSDHKGRRGTAVVSSDQLKNRCLVAADVLIGKLDSSLREEGLHCLARRSAGLAEDYHLLLLCHPSPLRPRGRTLKCLDSQHPRNDGQFHRPYSPSYLFAGPTGLSSNSQVFVAHSLSLR
jgi:hypothetical protein